MHESLLSTVWPKVAQALLDADVQLLCDEATLSALSSISLPKLSTHVRPSRPEDYRTEHLSLTISVLSVPSLSAAISHINSHSSHHTDCIVTEDQATAEEYRNAKGFGAVELGLQTLGKLARAAGEV